jgi:hypothetical protein
VHADTFLPSAISGLIRTECAVVDVEIPVDIFKAVD